MSLYYFLSARKNSVTLRLDINGVPQWLCTDGRSDSLTATLNQWIVPGQNNLQLRLDWPEENSYVPGAADVHLRLDARTDPRRSAGPAPEPLLEYAWPDDEDEEAYPAGRRLEFSVDEAPPTRVWTDAQPIDFTAGDEQEIAKLVGRLQAALTDRDVDRVTELLDYRAVDIGRAQYESASDSRQQHRAFFEKEFAQADDWRMQPIEPDDLEMHFVADGRLIWVTRADFEPAIATAAVNGCSLAIDLYVARIDGRWTVVR